MITLAQQIQMSFSIPQSDKKNALQVEQFLLDVLNKLEISESHLDIMGNAFKEFDNISPDALHEKRGLLNRYKQKVKKNFEEILKGAAIASHFLEYFSSDTQMAELNKSLDDEVKSLGKLVSDMLDALDDYRNTDFRTNILNYITSIHTTSSKLDQLIRERIVEHIDNNILNKNWKNDVIDNHHLVFEEKKPMLMEIFQNMKERFDQPAININKRQQSLNFSDNQRISTPTDIREVPENDDVGRQNDK